MKQSMWPHNSPWSVDSLESIGDVVALETESEKITYQKLAQLIRNISTEPQDRMTLSAKNDPVFIVSLLAAFNSNQQVLLVNPQWPSKVQNFCNDGIHQGSLIILTSGSSAYPKGIVLTHENLLASAQTSNKFYDFTGDDSWALSLPLYHIGGIMIILRTLLAGGTIKLPSTHNIRDILETNSSFYSFVPTQLSRILKDKSLTSLAKKAKAILVGGAKLIDSQYFEALESEIKISTTYGMTEMSSQVCAQMPGMKYESSSTGETLPGIQVSLNQEGRLLIDGPTLGAGTITEKEFTQMSHPYVTSDLAKIENTKVSILGRIDDIYISGGENISTQALESTLLESGLFTEIKLIAVDDSEFGQVGHAYYTASEKYPIELLKEKLLTKIAPYELPKKFFYLSNKQREVHGPKLQKNILLQGQHQT